MGGRMTENKHATTNFKCTGSDKVATSEVKFMSITVKNIGSGLVGVSKHKCL